MTTSADDTNRWYSIYVPKLVGADGVTTYESYLRLGRPDTTTEALFKSTLSAAYSGAAAEPAVRGAFGATPSAGIVLYTAGDLVQFVGGKADTRVLEDSYVVHVLNKAESAAVTKASSTATHRTYLRLGKPTDDVEGALSGSIPDDQIETYALAVAPTIHDGIDDTAKGDLKKAIVADPAASPTATTTDLTTAGVAARVTLAGHARRGDRAAIAALEELRTGASPNLTYDGAFTEDWAAAALHGVHAAFLDALATAAVSGPDKDGARVKLVNAAKGVTPLAPDPVARQRLVTLVSGALGGTAAADAASWARAQIDALGLGEELSARFSLGTGVALYSDQPISITTPATYSSIVGGESSSVLGAAYSETYDVSDTALDSIRRGEVNSLADLADKDLVTASLTARDLDGDHWLTASFTKALSVGFTRGATAAFGMTAAYAFNGGLSFTNALAGSLDATMGFGVAVPLALKVEAGEVGLTTGTSWGKVDYKQSNELQGDEIKIQYGGIPATAVSKITKAYTIGMQVALGVINAAAVAYTAAGDIIADKPTPKGDTQNSAMRDYLKSGEQLFITFSVLNGLLAAAGLLLGVAQLVASKAQQATNATPAGNARIVLNSGGILLHAGTTSLEITAAGIKLNGTVINLNAPSTAVTPAPLPVPASPVIAVSTGNAAATPAPTPNP
jgi:hypothetical protein